MRYGFVILLFILSCFESFCLHAQLNNRYIFRHLDQSDGLLHNKIFSIVQDAKGFIWILTPNGLQRYDGSRFVNYPYDPANPAGITYTSDCGLFADKQNNSLWIIHEGIEKLDLQKNSFTFYTAEQIKNDPLFGFETYKDSVGNPWLAGNFGVFRFDNDTKKLQPYHLTASWLSPGQSNSYYTDQRNDERWLTIWSYGLFLFDEKIKRVFSNNYNPAGNRLLRSMDKKPLFYVFTDSDKNTWISSSRPEFYKYDAATQRIIAYSLSDIKKTKEKKENDNAPLLVHCFFEDDHHNLWIGTQNAGLLKYDKQTNTFIHVTGQKQKQQNIEYNYDINCIFQDKEENIWIGTDKGITIFNPYQQYFHSVYHDESDPLSIPKNEIQECIETSTGEILAATWGGGITIYDNQWHFKKNIHFTSGPEEYNLLWSFIQNDDGTIWAGCQHGYIHIYDPAKETLHTIHPAELNNSTIRCMVKDKSGNIWMGLHNGRIAKWDETQNKFYPYDENVNSTPEMFKPVLCLFIDEQQRCWAGTEYGFKEFDTNKMTYSGVFYPGKSESHDISDNTVQSIDGFDNNTLLVGTVYSGLHFFNTQTKTFTSLNVSGDVASHTINNIKKDKNGHIWFTTDYGLYKFIIKNNSLIRYNIEPGIINSSFKSGNFYTLKDGRWIVTTLSEIICFDPDGLQKMHAGNSGVDITGFNIFDKPVFIDSFIYSNKPVNLSYRQNFLSIEYGALNFSGPQEVNYYYQLTGVDEDWVNAGAKRIANYTNLEPGEYTFKVKAGNDATEKITSFKITITPPFWKTMWFRLLVILLVIALAYFFLRKRIQAIRHESQLKHKIAETETMALRSQMNPHFIFNCLNAIDNLIQTNQKGKATTYLNRFARLIRSVLDSSKNNLVLFHKDFETLKLFLDLEQFRCSDSFEYKLSADAELLNSDIKVPPLIIQPFVENAIHHGLINKEDDDRKLNIDIKLEKEYIKYTITDNGIGRKKAAELKAMNKPEHVPYGIEISRKRVELHNHNGIHESIFITDLEKDNHPAGTKVELWLSPQ